MIWRLVTCSNLVTLLFAGVITGRVETPKGGEAAIWLEPVGEAAQKVPATPSKARIDQRNKTFSPHLMATQSGSSIAFPNHDPFFHNAFSNYSGQVFDTGLYAPGTSKVITFRRPGIVRVFCNIHPTMSAVIVVVDTPHFAVSSAKGGVYTIPNIPAGEYTLRVFYERATEATLDGLSTKVTVSETGTTAVPAIRISDAGYAPPPPHKNKFGKDYPAVIVDQYPGGKQ